MPQPNPRSKSSQRSRRAGFAAGPMVAVTFGTVFVVANSGGLRTPLPAALRALAACVAALLIVGLVRAGRRRQPQAPRATGAFGRRYLLVVGLEVVALLGGLILINRVAHHAEVSVAWVAVVVGLHFFGLAQIWNLRHYNWLGGVIAILGLAGFLIGARGGTATSIKLVAGVGSGVALYAAVALPLTTAVRGRLSTAESSPAESSPAESSP